MIFSAWLWVCFSLLAPVGAAPDEEVSTGTSSENNGCETLKALLLTKRMNVSSLQAH